MKQTVITILLAFSVLTVRAQWIQSIMHNPKRVEVDRIISGYLSDAVMSVMCHECH